MNTSVLVALIEQTGGLVLFTALLVRVSTAQNVQGVIAFVSGAVSAYSSSSGEVTVVVNRLLFTNLGQYGDVGATDLAMLDGAMLKIGRATLGAPTTCPRQ